MTRSKMFRLGFPLTLALAVASGAAVAQTKDQTSDTTIQGNPAEVQAATDAQLEQRVQSALHSNRYFLDAHVNVSIEDGNVVLRGLVFDGGELQDAIRIATQAAGGRRVIDELRIVDFT
jgi:osmotically-inducible protein OsmY